MSHTIVEPKDLFDSQRFGFSQAVVAKPGRLVAVSGQVSVDRELDLEQFLATMHYARPEDVLHLKEGLQKAGF